MLIGLFTLVMVGFVIFKVINIKVTTRNLSKREREVFKRRAGYDVEDHIPLFVIMMFFLWFFVVLVIYKIS